MTASGIAGAHLPNSTAHKSPAPAVELSPHSLDFSQTLQDRAALTDPNVEFAGRLASGAPSAVSFDRGELFGRAVDLHHQALAKSPEGALADRRSAPATSPDAPPAETYNRNSDAINRAEPDVAKVPIGFSDSGISEATRRSGQSIPDLASGAAHQLADVRLSVEAARNEPVLLALPSLRSARPTPASPAEIHASGPNDRAPGEANRQAAVAQFTPVNVVVRAAQTGVHVTARVGGLRTDEQAALETAIAETIEADGDALNELRLNGREIARSSKCQ